MSYMFLIIVIAIVIGIIALAAFTNLCLDNEHYDRLKWLADKWDYFATFVAVIVKIFDFPYGVETVGVVIAIGALMAGVLGVSAHNYQDDDEFEYLDEGDDE